MLKINLMNVVLTSKNVEIFALDSKLLNDIYNNSADYKSFITTLKTVNENDIDLPENDKIRILTVKQIDNPIFKTLDYAIEKFDKYFENQKSNILLQIANCTKKSLNHNFNKIMLLKKINEKFFNFEISNDFCDTVQKSINSIIEKKSEYLLDDALSENVPIEKKSKKNKK